ncbi:hypothetical protein PN36_31770 [Candidatus Thiomargarita nelsonii]|uniref:HEPN domain-containing protein n=1 Tax=Candidatus Thiomargarita nelsonii TaxID=1003181 RepID=A0A4E0QJY9_9GAMM|nr:hypothetical protein PN36_31770 [Candidatus Thiomargarita nelsonii]
MGLKARICRTLKWSGYPSTNKEFANYRSFKTHDLDVLLHLSGIEEKIKTIFFGDWSNVANLNPEARYEPIGTVSEADAYNMINATKNLVKVL